MADVAFKFAGMNNIADPTSIDALNPKSAQYGQCVDICNCDIDNAHNAISREGCTLAFTGNVSSCWTSSDGTTYCVYGGHLCTTNGITVTPLTLAFTVLSTCEFEQVNDIVVFSDNVKIGTIDAGTVTRIDAPAEWVDAEDLEQWVADNMPADPAVGASNFEVDAFALATKAGKCLHHFGGVLYLAINNFVYATKTFNVAKMDIRYNVVAGFPDDVTMIKHVENGLYIGTTAACYFLAHTGVVVGEDGKYKAGFKQTQVAPYGVIYGTSLTVHAELIPEIRSKDLAVLWASSVGIFAGVSGGTASNLSIDKVTLPDETTGTAIVKDYKLADKTRLHQYVVCFPSSTWVLNLSTLAHSRFTNYPYTSLFKHGEFYYGANTHGVVKFGGATDYVVGTGLTQQIDALVRTPATDFGSDKVKRVRLIHTRVRRDAILAIDCTVDEIHSFVDGSIPRDGVLVAHTARQKAPRGLKGVYWQFTLHNVRGGSFTVFNLEPVVDVSTTRTK